MSDEKTTPAAREAMRDAVLAEVLGDVSKVAEQVNAIHAELVTCNKELKEELQTALSSIRATSTAEKNKMKDESAKLVRDGVISETSELKRAVNNLIIELNRAAEKLRSAKRWDFISYVVLSSFGVALATLFVEKVILTH